MQIPDESGVGDVEQSRNVDTWTDASQGNYEELSVMKIPEK